MPERERKKQHILEYFKDINLMYNNPNMHDDLSRFLDELTEEQDEQLAMMRMIYGTDAKVVGEIVRCKDCKWGEWLRNMRGDGRYRCKNDYTGIECGCTKEPDFFCAYGERR